MTFHAREHSGLELRFAREAARGHRVSERQRLRERERELELAGNRQPGGRLVLLGASAWRRDPFGNQLLAKPERKRRCAWTPFDTTRGRRVGRVARARGRGARPLPRASDPADQRRDRNRSTEGALSRMNARANRHPEALTSKALRRQLSRARA
jgi:hypothetical protein